MLLVEELALVYKFLFILISAVTLVSCAPVVETGKRSSVSFKFPKSNYNARSIQSVRRMATASTSSYGLPDITSIDDIDCYVLAIGYENLEEESGKCGSGLMGSWGIKNCF